MSSDSALKFSANLGFLWTELSLVDAIHAAHRAGFDAVECHWPYDTPAPDVAQALSDTGLRLLSLNTVRGNTAKGEMGLCALPNRQSDARRSIDQAIDYAAQVDASFVHVMAGITTSSDARSTFIDNLRYTCEQAAKANLSILIEPLNTYDTPNYFLTNTSQAVSIIDAVGAANLRLMFDCYHVARMEGDILSVFKRVQPYIGHIQFADPPNRTAPSTEGLDFKPVFDTMVALGWNQPFGAEYKPNGPTDLRLGWMRRFR